MVLSQIMLEKHTQHFQVSGVRNVAIYSCFPAKLSSFSKRS